MDPVVGALLVAAVSTVGLSMVNRVLAMPDRRRAEETELHAQVSRALDTCRQEVEEARARETTAQAREAEWREKYYRCREGAIDG